MSLFLVMRRYDCSLRDYLSVYAEQLTTRISSVLFTQLLEGVAFLHQTGVAHRDLKSDNILIDISGGVDYPRLVITDFGCCLADSNHKLKLPYTTYDTDKGGNPALMAPEVASAKPGAFKTIDYSKSDLWTAGTIAYEIFGGLNPFYSNQTSPGLLSTNYTMDDLPSMPEGTPVLLSRLVRTILSPAPSSRPEPKQAATICQLYLWSPSQWIKTTGRVSSQDVLQWLLTMTTKVLCESRWGNSESALQEYQLVATFLTTTTLTDIKSSISWIQAVAAKARKSEKLENEKAAKQKAAEDKLWQDDDKNLAKKQKKKEEEEKKRMEALAKKKERQDLAAMEEKEIQAKLVKANPVKLTQARIREETERRELVARGLKAAQQPETHLTKPLEENVNRLQVEGEEARSVEEAIAVLKVADEDSGVDKHPEKRMKAAYEEFENRRLPQLKQENPNMRLSQLKQMLRKEWQKHPDNPLIKQLAAMQNR